MTGATAELVALLSGLPCLDFAPVTGRSYASRVQVTPALSDPLERQKVAADVRLEAIACTPTRVNVVIEGSVDATAAAIRFVLGASSVTGQVLAAAPLKRPAQ